MSVKVKISPRFQDATDGVAVIEVNCNSLEDCLKQLVKRFPSLEKMLLDNNGKLLSYVMVFINRQAVQQEGLAKSVTNGDEIYFMHMIGGG